VQVKVKIDLFARLSKNRKKRASVDFMKNEEKEKSGFYIIWLCVVLFELIIRFSRFWKASYFFTNVW